MLAPRMAGDCQQHCICPHSLTCLGKHLPVVQQIPRGVSTLEKDMKRRELLLGLGAAGLAVSVSIAGEAQAATWIKLGERNVNGALDVDTIHVGGRATFGKLKLLVRGNDCYFYDMDVIYRNGGHDDIPLRFEVPQGGESRVIDLRGGERRIRRVTFKYGKPRNWKGSTTVELWGRL